MKKKIKTKDMSVEAITDTIQEYMYEKIHESKDSEEETKIKHVNRIRTSKTRKRKPKQLQQRRLHRMRCTWNKQHDCPAKAKKCLNCGKIGHYAKKFRSEQTTNRKKNNFSQRPKQLVTKQNASDDKNGPLNNTNNPRWTNILHFNGFGYNRSIKIIIDDGSPVTLIPKQKVNGMTLIRPLQAEYRDVNKNKIGFEGKTTANVETNREKNWSYKYQQKERIHYLNWVG